MVVNLYDWLKMKSLSRNIENIIPAIGLISVAGIVLEAVNEANSIV